MAFIQIDTIYGTSAPVPYSSSDLAGLQITQSGSSLYLSHPDHPPAKVTKVSDTDWRYELLDIVNGPYTDRAPSEDNYTLSVTSSLDRIVLTSTAAIPGAAAGAYIEYPHKGSWALARIVTVLSSTSVLCDCLEDRSFVPSSEVYCRGSNAGSGALPLFRATAPTTLSGTGSPVFSHSFVVTRDTVGNYLRFYNDIGNTYWMLVTAIKAPSVSSASYGASADGDLLSVIRSPYPIVVSQRLVTGMLVAQSAGFFDTTRDIGRYYRLKFDDRIIHTKTVAHVSNNTQQMSVDLSDPIPYPKERPENVARTQSTIEWDRGAFYKGNYPRCIALHEQRMVFAGTYAEPNTVWMSKSGDFTDFATSDYEGKVLDDSGLNVTLASSTLNEILWVTSRSVLLIGTSGGEWSLSASSNREALTPTNVKAEQHSAYGSKDTSAVVAGKSTLFIQASGKKLREMAFDVGSDGYVSQDMTVFSEHILKDHGTGLSLAYQLIPDSCIYTVCGDGQVAVMTYEPEQKVYAWSRYILGGPNARVNSVAVDQVGEDNIIYLNVTRTVNGSQVTTIETLRAEFRPGSSTDKGDMIFMDAYQSIPLGSLVSNAIPSSYLTAYLGQSVELLVDNQHYTVTCPVSGNLTLPATPSTRVVIGYAFRSYLKTLPMDLPSPQGTSQAKTKRISQLAFRLLNTSYLEYGPDDSTLRPLNPTAIGSEPTGATPMFSGDVRVPFDGSYEGRQSMVVTTSKPLPLTLLAIYPEVTQTQ